MPHHAAAPRAAYRNRCARAIAPLALVAATVLRAGAEPVPESRCNLEAGPSQAVVRVLDAETVAVDDGSAVRLIGALAPRAPGADTDPPSWPAEVDARKALETLVLGRTIELAFAGRRSDRYGRRLAQVFVDRDGERVWVQGYLLSHGHARAYALAGNTACLKELIAHEAVARESGQGLWASGAYKLRRATRTRELLERRNSFEIVDGRVALVAEKGKWVYLNFGADWRSDFSVAVPSRIKRSSPEAGAWLEALAGKRVRVRGWIERRNGPLIEVADLDQIEILPDDNSRDLGPGEAAATGGASRPFGPPAPRP